MWASCSWPSVHSPPARPRAQDGQLCFTALDTLSSAGRVRQDHGDAVTAVAASPAAEHLVYASAGQAVLAVDVRKVRLPACAPLWPARMVLLDTLPLTCSLQPPAHSDS